MCSTTSLATLITTTTFSIMMSMLSMPSSMEMRAILCSFKLRNRLTITSLTMVSRDIIRSRLITSMDLTSTMINSSTTSII